MSLEQTLKTVAGRLRSGRLVNEAQVKQAVILPILRALGWDDTDPEECRPEYSAGSGRVDYALLDRNKPLVFIEAKQTGKLDAGGEGQLFRYASNRGVPLLVLTDGDRWDFYLSMADGVPSERRFYRLELRLGHKIAEYTKSLEQYLSKDRVVSRQARIDAEHRLTRNRERERARRAIPEAWRLLLNEPDETLRNRLAEKVESKWRTKPELDDVDMFLQEQSKPYQQQPTPPVRPPPPAAPATSTNQNPRICLWKGARGNGNRNRSAHRTGGEARARRPRIHGAFRLENRWQDSEAGIEESQRPAWKIF